MLVSEHHALNLATEMRDRDAWYALCIACIRRKEKPWKFSVAAQITSAMNFLHTKLLNVVHVDVESVLIVEESPPLIRLTQHGIR